jgi:ATP-binding cassette subfamily C (CFTR/MRP) protein 4
MLVRYTVLTIPHRLNTIMDHDKIMIMSFGKGSYSSTLYIPIGSVVEYDSPQALLKNFDSEFSRLVADSKQIMRTRSRELSELQGA